MSETIMDFRKTVTNALWEAAKIDLSQQIEPPEAILTQIETGIPFLYRRGIHVISGRQKNGKTFLSTLTMASILNPCGFGGFEPSKTGLKVLFIDTEQDRADTHEVMARVHRLNEWSTVTNYERFVGLNLREYSVEDRTKLTEQSLRDVRPDVLIIDGIVDLCLDFNSLEESHKLTTMLMQWAAHYNCAIITALHINKGNDELRGHLGAFLAQKGENVIRVSKENDGLNYMSCKVIESRHRPINDFNFRIVEGMPEIYEPEISTKATVNYEAIFKDALKQPLRYGELVGEIVKITGKSIPTSKRYIDAATNLGIIENKNGIYECKNNLPF
jgi:hypothetical protein